MKQSFTIQNLKTSACAGRNEAILSNAEPKKQNKFRNNPVEFGGRKFQSTKERDRYITLRILEKQGKIQDLECQVEFILEMEDKKVCSYFADYVYKFTGGATIVEDVKSGITRRLAIYRLKKRLMLAYYGIEIKEV